MGAIKRSKAPRLYICNLMTQPGETDGLDVRGHIRAIEAQLATLGIEPRLFNAVLAQDDLPESDLVRYYQSRGALIPCDAMRKGSVQTATTSPKHRFRGLGRQRHCATIPAALPLR